MNKRIFVFILFYLFPFYLWAGVDFDAGSERFSATGVTITTGSFTWTAWIKPDILSGHQILFRHSSAWRVQLYVTNLRFTVPGIADYTFTTLPLVTGTWQFIAVTVTGTTATGYLGTKSESLTITAPTGTPSDFVAGDADFSLSLDGSLDDLRVYSRVLTVSELESLANSRTRLVLTDGLRLWWCMDDGIQGENVVSVRDRSINNYTGTPSGTLSWILSPWLSYP